MNDATESQPLPIDQELLDILACPETKESVSLADSALIKDLNEKAKSGQLKNRGGGQVSEGFEAGLLRADGKILYVIRDGIPVMLIDEGIELSS